MRRAAVIVVVLVSVGCGGSSDDTLDFDLPTSEASVKPGSSAGTSSAGSSSPGTSSAVTPAPGSSVPGSDGELVDVGEPADAFVGAIAGFGVNGQPRNWGTDGRAVKPALDMLVGDMGASLFRIEIYRGASDWEVSNDNDDPSSFDWTSFDEIFTGKNFEDLYEYVRYLNTLGVDAIELSSHGLVPDWMGTETVTEDMEDEFIETSVAFLLYIRTRIPEPRPRFSWFSPWNESNLGTSEGITLDVDRQVRLLEMLILRMDEFPELDDIGIIAPESSDESTSIAFREQVEGNATISARLSAIAFHRYGGFNTTQDWQGAQPPQWLTEFNDWEDFCYEVDWNNAFALAGNLLGALGSGVTAGMVWTDFDAPHIHQADQWQSFGLLSTASGGTHDLCEVYHAQPTDAELDALTYAPKPTYFAFRHFAKYIRPGAVRIPVGVADDLIHAVAFQNLDGTVVVVGLNDGDSGSYEIAVDVDPSPATMSPLVSTDGSFMQELDPVTLVDGEAMYDLPSRSVFTLVGNP